MDLSKKQKIVKFISENQSEQGVARSKISSRLGISYYVLETLLDELEKSKLIKKEVSGTFIHYKTTKKEKQ